MVTMQDADRLYKDLGAVRAADSGVEQVRNGRREFYHMFTHFFNDEGGEIGYVTVPIMSMPGYALLSFETPRVWAPEFVADLRNWRAL